MVLSDGELVGWLARGGHHLVTFLPKEEGAAVLRTEELAKALVRVAQKRHRSMLIATIDGVAAPESPCARVFLENGFVARQGALVRIAGEGGARLGARRHPDELWPDDDEGEDVDAEMVPLADA